MIPVGQGINGATQLVYQPSFLPVVLDAPPQEEKGCVCLSDDAVIGLWVGMGSSLASEPFKRGELIERLLSIFLDTELTSSLLSFVQVHSS